MKVKAQAKYLRSSARKLRLAADLVRGMRVLPAEELLANTNKKAAVLVSDAVKSAVASAEHNYNISKNQLTIEQVYVGEGPSLKRFRPRARGSAGRILKRTSHLTVIVSDEAKTGVKPDDKSAAQASAKPANEGIK